MGENADSLPMRRPRQPSIVLSEGTKERLAELRKEGYELATVHDLLIDEGLVRREDGRRGYEALRRQAVKSEGGKLRDGGIRLPSSEASFQLTTEMRAIVEPLLAEGLPDWAIKDDLIERGLIPAWRDERAYDAIQALRLRSGRRPTTSEMTRPYVRSDEDTGTAPKDTLQIDPDALDRGSKAHRALQNRISEFAAAHGLRVVSPTALSPAEFDLGWQDGVEFVLVEIKSMTDGNEVQQLRLGLGQVLDYQHSLEPAFGAVRPVLVVERAPHDASRWRVLCERHGVQLAWPGALDELVG